MSKKKQTTTNVNKIKKKPENHIMPKHTDIELFIISSKIGLGNWYLAHHSATSYIS